MINLGGKDSASIKAFYGFPNLMYISELVDNNDEQIHRFLIENYFENGAALFGRESKDELNDFRKVCKGALEKKSDADVYAIIQYLVQRLRNYGHLNSLQLARIDKARIAASPFPRTEMCKYYEGKIISVQDCVDKVEWLHSMSPDEQGVILRSKGLGFPPLYKLCRCSLEGLIKGIDF